MKKIITDPVTINPPLTAFIDAQAEMFRSAIVAAYELPIYSLPFQQHTMISQKIATAILALIAFADEQLLAAVEDLTVKASALSLAGFTFDKLYPDGTGDNVGGSIIRLAQNLAPLSSSTSRTEIQEDFNAVFSPADPAQDEAGQNLFSATLDFAVSAATLNELIASRQTPVTP